jgi:uncharacterized protein DUF4268
MSLGRLENVDLRQVWATESEEFTPWLAREENISLLGEAISLDLEVEAQEKNVGPFRADILCKDTATDAWVLIENQLERTDHCHLGQLLTYAAGLQAVTIVWISQRFTEEHRATLDWLNEITDDRFNFFGLEIELWRIGNSPIAPKFNVVSKPNDWTKTVSTAAKRIESGELSVTRQKQLQFWTEFRDFLLERGSVLRPQKPQAQHWTNFAIGRSNFWLVAFANFRDLRIGCGLVLSGPEAKAHFRLLEEDKLAIEAEMKTPLDWEELPEKKESHIFLRRHGADASDASLWPEQHAWLADKLEAMHRTFSLRVKQLNADDLESSSSMS